MAWTNNTDLGVQAAERGVADDAVAAADEGAGTLVGEELAREIGGGGDGHRGGAGKVLQKSVDLLDLELGAKLDPGLLEEALVLLVEVDDINLLAGLAVGEAAGRVEIHNLEGLQALGNLASGNVGVHVEDLTLE